MSDDARRSSDADELARLRAQNLELERDNAELRAKLTALDAQFRRFLRRVLAPRSEKLIHEPGQQRIAEIAALAAELEAIPSPPPLTDPPAAKGKPAKPPARQRGRGMRTLPAHLDVVEERIELTPAQRLDHDGSPLVPVGTERAERLDWEPGRFIRRVTLRTRYGAG